MTKLVLREDIEVTVDEDIVDFLCQFESTSWYRLSNTIKLNARSQEKKLVDGNRLVTLNRLVWWFNYGEWPDKEKRLRHANKKEMDFRLTNLITQTPKVILKENTVAASNTKGIYKDPRAGGRYRVRGYSATAGKVIYLGHRETLEEAIKLKQLFMEGKFIPSRNSKVRNIKPL